MEVRKLLQLVNDSQFSVKALSIAVVIFSLGVAIYLAIPNNLKIVKKDKDGSTISIELSSEVGVSTLVPALNNAEYKRNNSDRTANSKIIKNTSSGKIE
ncbi:MAG: hypothetical protein JKY66_01295 [Spongiibacteraceae bacterium]|nr:hypothetical protein [Spongiibacteraceae bacterium]